MPEIKRTFTAGKMNKDLDERLVRNGEYRDALNIQVRTTDGEGTGIGDAGTVQNIKGNNNFTPEIYKTIGYNQSVDAEGENNTNITRFLGSVADEKNDKAYFLAAAPWPIITNNGLDIPIVDFEYLPHDVITNNQIADSELVSNDEDFDPHNNVDDAITQGSSPKIWVDSIIELDAVNESTNPIFIDKYAVTGRWHDCISVADDAVQPPSPGFTQINVIDGSLYRVGMIMYIQNNDGEHLLFRNGENNNDGNGAEIVDIQGNTLTLSKPQVSDLYDLYLNSSLDWSSAVKFVAERVLEFDYWKIVSKGSVKLNLIPNVNLINDLLFWTDGINEPKKINITRSKRGTSLSGYSSNPMHTKLFVSDPSDQTATYPDDLVDVRDLEPSLVVEGGDVLKENVTVIREAPKSPPSLYMRNTDRTSEINFVVSYNFTDEELVPPLPNVGTLRTITDDVFLGIDIRINDVLTFTNTFYDQNPIIIKAVVTEVNDNTITVRIMFLDNDYDQVTLEQNLWNVLIEQKKPLFETKFGRVAYRYKYEDGEYSTYSPWSELAFLPGPFSYTPSQGFNNGMSNNLRYLVVKDFIPDTSIRPLDVQAIDILWKTTDDQNVYIVKTITREIDSEWEDYVDPDLIEGELENTGALVITSEMIHRVLPTNQLFRGYDNVPKTAVTQEITANRLVYGNYTQGYDIKKVVGLKQLVVSDEINFPRAEKSVKSLRSYKFGMVFGDRYGRETPVIANGYKVVEGELVSGDISVEKSLAHFSNKFNVKQQWGSNGNSSPLNWIDYVKYYVKETSNEYYNLVLDRWYDAGDGNIWLAFPSVDRNKVDEQTYLILKNEHGNQNPVAERARYKILAIANEAPDFVKTDHRTMGRVQIDRQGIYDVEQGTQITDGVPDGLISTRKIRTSDDNFGGVDLSESNGPGITTTDFKGTIKVRIVGTYVPDGGDANNPIEAFSPWRTASRIKATGSRRGCDIREVYSADDVNMFTKIQAVLSNPAELDVDDVDQGDGDNAADQIKYFMEFKDEVVENKPQFDGRFFVKILKDEVLSQAVLNISAGTGNYQVQDTYSIGYIANWDSNPAQDSPFYGAGPQATFAWPTDANGEDVAGFTEANIDSWPNGVPNFGIGNTDSTELFWEWWSEQVEEGNAPSIFVDQVPCYSDYVYFQELDYVNLPEDVPPGGSLEGSILQFYGSGLGPLNYAGAGGNWQPAGLSIGRCTEPDNFGQLTLSTCTKDGSGFRAGKDSIFKSIMQEPGTLFRFQGDPDQTVYRVIPMTQLFTGNTPESDVWDSYTYTDLFLESGISGAEQAQAFMDDYLVQNPSCNSIEINDTNYPASWVQFLAEYTVTAQMGPVEGPISISGAVNFPLSGEQVDGDYDALYPQKRHSIITRFGRVGTDGVTDTSRGVDISRWDPRGEVKHTGLEGFVIEVLDEVNEGELLEDTVATSSACWETEPKENIDVDIYYEASRGIPMYLTKNNINEYVDPSYNIDNACLFHVDRRTLANGSVHPVNFINAYVQRTLGDDCVHIVKNTPDGAKALTTQIITFTDARGVSIGDVVAFHHIGYHSNTNKRYALMTRSKVLDHMKPRVYGNAFDNIVDVPVQSDRYGPITGDSVNLLTEELNPYRITFDISDWTNGGGGTVSDMNITEGMEVISGNTDVGTFVTDILVTANQQQVIVIVNKPVLVKGTGRFTFIDVTGWFRIERDTWKFDVDLGWFNCYSFGNGVESDRIRDDFNAPQIDNGVRVSSTFLEYREEHLSSNLIHSSEIFNSTSGINGLNQFNMAEKITKSLNPIYGSIQRLKTRDTNLVTFCEDKVLKVLASKDALFNADGNTNLTATDRVLGTAIPFVGDYGISKNPESLATDTYRLYFTDKQRGAVLRLSGDGLTPISNVGMKTYFREFLPKCDNIIGTYDVVNGEYNVTLSINEVEQGETVCACTTCCGCGCSQAVKPQTITFNEGGKAWVSFKSFVFACGSSVSGKYFTAPLPFHRGDQAGGSGATAEAQNQNGSPLTKIWMHHDETVNRNNFYGAGFQSEIEVTFNDMPDTVKSFKAINYEGSRANIEPFTQTVGYDVENPLGTVYTDGNYYNLSNQNGWKVNSFDTDLQNGFVPEFIQKENKWFNFIHGEVTTVNNLDTTAITGNVAAFNVQGIGFILEDPTDTQTEANVEVQGNNPQNEED